MPIVIIGKTDDERYFFIILLMSTMAIATAVAIAPNIKYCARAHAGGLDFSFSLKDKSCLDAEETESSVCREHLLSATDDELR